MAQSGIFRTSMRGFNKAEVLQYVEDLNVRVTAEQEAATEEIARLQQQVSELQTKLNAQSTSVSDAEENAAQLQKLVDEYRRTVQDQQQQLDVAQAEVQRLLAENTKLSEQQVSPAQRQQFIETEEKYRLVLAENRRYRALIGHVGTFVAEVRRMNQGILDTTCCRETEIIDAANRELSKVAESLEENRRELSAIKDALTQRRDAADTRLTAMIDQLEKNAQVDGFSSADA